MTDEINKNVIRISYFIEILITIFVILIWILKITGILSYIFIFNDNINKGIANFLASFGYSLNFYVLFFMLGSFSKILKQENLINHISRKFSLTLPYCFLISAFLEQGLGSLSQEKKIYDSTLIFIPVIIYSFLLLKCIGDRLKNIEHSIKDR
jgi:hypothetical protein